MNMVSIINKFGLTLTSVALLLTMVGVYVLTKKKKSKDLIIITIASGSYFALTGIALMLS